MVTGNACTAACTHTDIVPCCGNGTVEANEDCDVGIASGTGSCSAITCNDGIACTNDLPLYPGPADSGEPALTAPGASGTGNACLKYCYHAAVTSATSDSCCPPGASSTQDPDCLCGNMSVDTSAYEQCDDGPGGSAACTTSCTVQKVAVGAPCGMDSDCTYPNAPLDPQTAAGQITPVCVYPGLMPPLSTLFINGYCSAIFCNPSTATDPAAGGAPIPYAVTSCPQIKPYSATFTPNSLCVPFGSGITGCVALCDPTHGNADCRINEVNTPAMSGLGPEAYRCTQIAATTYACLPRQPTF
jgi:hypothetical protein